MSNKILMPQLITLLAANTGKPKKQAEAFLKAFFNTIVDGLEAHETVKIKNFGTFKVNRIEARKSINVSTGEDVKIPAHYRVVFTPAKNIAENVNKEFAWLDIVEISENVSNNDIDAIETDHNKEAEEIVVVVPPVTQLPVVEEELPAEVKSEEGESGEELGEELEKEFGEIEPVEPFGPIDPDDPEPDEPISDAVAPQPHEPIAHAMNVPFDPYAIEAKSVSPPEEEEVQFVTKDDIANFVSKDDLKVLNRNLKKIKNILDRTEERNNERSKNTILWSLILCVVLLACGFFVLYYMIVNKLEADGHIYTEQTVQNPSLIESEEEYSPASLNNLEDGEIVILNEEEGTEPNSSESSSQGQPEKTSDSAPAPTSPSDIKAMDKVTSTRYLTTMAKEHYGNYNLWPYIYKENEEKLGHPDRIKPGTSIVIPNLAKYNIDPKNPKDVEKARKLGVEIYKKYSGM